MKYFSTFSGIGGFELGIGDKGECVGYSEIDKYAIKIYERHFTHKNYGDITKLSADTEADARAKMLVYLLQNKLLAL